MTKDEALKLALEALENISTALREDDVLGSDSELMLDAITAIEEALDECDEDELIIRYHEMTIKRLEKRIEELTAQPEQEPVGSVVRWVDGSLIHGWFGDPPPEGTLLYITPPQRPWVGLTEEEVIEISHLALTRVQAVQMTQAKLKEKNT